MRRPTSEFPPRQLTPEQSPKPARENSPKSRRTPAPIRTTRPRTHPKPKASHPSRSGCPRCGGPVRARGSSCWARRSASPTGVWPEPSEHRPTSPSRHKRQTYERPALQPPRAATPPTEAPPASLEAESEPAHEPRQSRRRALTHQATSTGHHNEPTATRRAHPGAGFSSPRKRSASAPHEQHPQPTHPRPPRCRRRASRPRTSAMPKASPSPRRESTAAQRIRGRTPSSTGEAQRAPGPATPPAQRNLSLPRCRRRASPGAAAMPKASPLPVQRIRGRAPSSTSEALRAPGPGNASSQRNLSVLRCRR